MRTEYKDLTWRHVKTGEIINHFKLNSHSSFWGKYYVADANVARITLWPVLPDGTYNHTEPIYANSDEFRLVVEMTRDELRDKYHTKAREVVEALQNVIPYDAIGDHEMWNGWVGVDAFEFAQASVDENFKVIGVCYDIEPKSGVIDRSWMYDVGVVCECDDGERFWCHYKSDYLQDIFDEWGIKR
jgi:hypothetical protein